MMLYMENRRRRAPRRAGHRTTLTVPPSVHDAAQQLARELDTTANDALVRLAQEGAAARARRAKLTALATQRQAAIERVPTSATAGSTFPSPEELQAAMLAGRSD